ncbi:MAG: glycosyl hydrolase family 88 [Treponema sp. GWA1_62_8]|nr:MAG: glycosyl hydrolase family 88 [Treponema sp. GWA1_62_8]
MIEKKSIEVKLASVVGRLKNLQRPADENRIAADRPDGGKTVGLFPRDFGFQAWDWPQGVGLYGLHNLYQVSHDESIKTFAKDWYERHFSSGLPVRNINTTIPLLALSYLLDEMEPACAGECRDWAEWLMTGLPKTRENGFQHTTTNDAAKGTINLNEGQLWIDTLFMTVLFLARMGRLTGDRRFMSEATHQFLVHVKYLFDKRSGLFYHGWSFPENDNFGGVFWCRGNSWYVSSVIDFIEIMDQDLDAGVRDFLLDTCRAQVTALSALQDASGLWRTVLDDPGSYTETSGSAGIAYGILKGIRLGLLDPRHQAIAESAVQAILSNIAEDGTVKQVSAGTGMGMDRDHYRNIIIAPMAYGQSLTIMALAEYLRSALP